MQQHRIYRGWWMVLALFLAGMMVYGAGLYGFSLMIVPLSAEFGWSRAATGGLVSVFWLSAPLALLGGQAVARMGAVRLIVLGILIEVACLTVVSGLSSLAAMYVLRALMGLGKIMVMAGVVAQAGVWFRRRFGLAISICYAGWHFGGLVLAPVATALIQALGWRSACLSLAGLIGIFSLPPIIFLQRWQPGSEVEIVEGPAVPVGSGSVDFEQRSGSGLTSRDFWLVIVMTVLGGLAYGSLVTHLVAMIDGFGMGNSAAALALSVTAGLALAGALIAGQLIDTHGFRSIISLEFGLMTLGVIGFLLLMRFPNQALMLMSAAACGFAIGGFDTCFVSYLKRRFGSAELNQLFGVWYFFALATLFLGPILTGRLFDIEGSYRLALLTMLVSLLAGLVMTVWVQPEPDAASFRDVATT